MSEKLTYEELEQRVRGLEQAEMDGHQTLQASTEELRLVIDTSPVGICTVDLLGNFITTNLAYELMVGYSKEELRGLSFFDVTHTDDRPKNKKLFQDMFSLETTRFYIDKRYIRKDGAEINVVVHATGIRDADGNISLVTAFVEDITERKKVKKLLQKSYDELELKVEERTRELHNELQERKKAEEERDLILASSMDLICIATLDGYFTYVNPVCEKLLGYSNKELLSQPYQNFIYPDDHEENENEVFNLNQGQKSIGFNNRYVCKDGSLLHIEWAATPYIEENLIYAIGRDVTERKQAEEALRNSERFLRSTVDVLTDHLLVLDDRGKIILTNKAYRDFAVQNGIDPFTVSEGANYLTVCDTASGEHSEEASLFAEGIREVLSGKSGSFKLEYPCHSPDEEQWFVAHVMPFDEEGSRQMIVAHQNITEHKRTENSLQEAHQRLLTIFNSLDVMVYVADMETYEVLFANKRITQRFGDITGKVCWQCLQKDQSAPCEFCYNDKLLDENDNPTAPYTFDNKNTITGQWYSNLDRVIVWYDGRLVRLCISTDITNRKQLENDLRDAKETLEIKVKERTLELQKTHAQLLHAEKMSSIGKLSASIAHEFNSPLAGITNVIRGIKKRNVFDEDDAELIDMAIHECRRMKDLILSLQDFNRPTSCIMALFDIHNTIDSLLLLSKQNFHLKQISVEKKYADNLPQIKAGADQIKQVILNLINNGAEACEKGGVITISSKKDNGNIVLHIKDNGIGIKPEDINHIFDPFFTTKPEVKGTGLGLSVSYGIVKKHGGRLEVKSSLGKGSVFTVTLPIAGVIDA